uniref:Uncharacterized protein n=1 Tax=Arundo donax TaxID=35708 RepID=A0A0A8ZKA0_ARUDO
MLQGNDLAFSVNATTCLYAVASFVSPV